MDLIVLVPEFNYILSIALLAGKLLCRSIYYIVFIDSVSGNASVLFNLLYSVH